MWPGGTDLKGLPLSFGEGGSDEVVVLDQLEGCESGDERVCGKVILRVFGEVE